MRASARQSARFSSRDSVGWLIRSAPLSGARPHAIFRAGSERNASTSSQSSYPAAIMHIRAIAISAKLCRTREGSRSSPSGPVIVSASPRRLAISRSTTTPPSDDRRPASKLAVSGLPSTGDRPGKIDVAFMAMGGGSGGDAHELLRHQIPTPTQRLRRRPSTLLAPPHE
jgi:hypothetical protein